MSESVPGASGFLYANAALRVLEQAAIEDAGGDGFVLMARAGAAACRVALARWPQARRIVVVCGPGNNGGDGYVIAETLRQRGLAVTVVAPMEPKTDAATNARSVIAHPSHRHRAQWHVRNPRRPSMQPHQFRPNTRSPSSPR